MPLDRLSADRSQHGGAENQRAGRRSNGHARRVALDPARQHERHPYNHYSLLRSVEDLFGVGHLGYAAATGLQSFGDDVFNSTPASATAPPKAKKKAARKHRKRRRHRRRSRRRR